MSDAATWFGGIAACLWRDQLPEWASDPDLLRMAKLSGLAIVTMSTSCTVKDKVTGVTYMDTVTTLVGQVTPSGPGRRPCPRGLQYRMSWTLSSE